MTWVCAPAIPKNNIKMEQIASLLSLARRRYGRSLAVQPNCLKGRVVSGTVYGDMHVNKSPGTGIYHKSRVLYTGTGFLSSATWPSMLKENS